MRRSIRCFHISPGQPPRVFELYKTGWFRLKFTKKELIYRTKKKELVWEYQEKEYFKRYFLEWGFYFKQSIYLFIYLFIDVVNTFLGRKGNVLRSSCGWGADKNSAIYYCKNHVRFKKGLLAIHIFRLICQKMYFGRFVDK